MSDFPPDVVEAVLRHMNDDHHDDSLDIVRGHGVPDAAAAVMTGLDAVAGTWEVVVGGSSRSVRIPWTERAVERADLRREVVRLHATARARLDPS